MILENLKLSSEQFWMSAIITPNIDVLIIYMLIWRIKSSRFRDLKWILVYTYMRIFHDSLLARQNV